MTTVREIWKRVSEEMERNKLYERKNEPEYEEPSKIKEKLLYQRIVGWTEDYLLLENGTSITIGESEQDCCAGAWGEFSKVKLDAMITDVQIGEIEILEDREDGHGMTTNKNTLTIYHNQNLIARADMTANDGNGGFYYSIGSVVIDKIHFPIVGAL